VRGSISTLLSRATPRNTNTITCIDSLEVHAYRAHRVIVHPLTRCVGSARPSFARSPFHRSSPNPPRSLFRPRLGNRPNLIFHSPLACPPRQFYLFLSKDTSYSLYARFPRAEAHGVGCRRRLWTITESVFVALWPASVGLFTAPNTFFTPKTTLFGFLLKQSSSGLAKPPLTWRAVASLLTLLSHTHFAQPLFSLLSLAMTCSSPGSSLSIYKARWT
jgi:hypothetical protein